MLKTQIGLEVMKTEMCEMKKSTKWINDVLDIGKEMIIELEDMASETIQIKHIKMTEKETVHSFLTFTYKSARDTINPFSLFLLSNGFILTSCWKDIFTGYKIID